MTFGLSQRDDDFLRLTILTCVFLLAAGTALAASGSTGQAAGEGQATGALSPEDSAKADRLREDLRRMIASARDRVFPALININVVTLGYWDGKERKGRSVGSGTIISPEGYVLTNQHVTDNGKKFKCILSDKQEITADLVGEDPLTDLAVLKLHLGELRDPGAPLPVATFGRSDDLQIGDYVMAMGSPFALARSVTLGIVSNTERVLAGGVGGSDVEDMELGEGQRTGLFTRWIQHDALINPGNSGGPLVNLKGEIIGINELGGSATGFAIPSGLARTVAEALIRHGEVPRSWIGASFRSIEKTGLEKGVLVNSIVKGGPAEKAGLQAGDVILAMNGEPVTVRFAEEIPPLLKRIADQPIGSELRIAYTRGDASRNATITTEKLKKDRGDESAFRGWGFTATEITDRIALNWRLDNKEGAMLSGVRDGGSAQLAEPPLQAGDIIRSIDRQPIRTLDALVARYEKIMETKPLPEYLLVEFDRRGRNHVTLLKPKPDEEEPPPREVPKAWIGIATQPVLDKLATRLKESGARGFRITRVYPGTTAAESGLQVGDIVTALNGEKITPRGMQDAGLLALRVRKLNIGDKARLSVLRGGQREEVTVTLDRTRITQEEARVERNRDFELTVREVTFFDRDENRWGDDIQGVIVQQVESAGWAGLGGVETGDLIQWIQGREIRDPAGFKAAMQAVSQAQPERVVVVVLRGSRTRYLYLEPDWKPAADPKKTTTTSSPATTKE